MKLLAVGFGFAYFFSASSAIYLLQRRHVDATEMDEVFLDADASESPPALPQIVPDAAGSGSVASFELIRDHVYNGRCSQNPAAVPCARRIHEASETTSIGFCARSASLCSRMKTPCGTSGD